MRIARSGPRRLLAPCETVLSASISRPLSVSSISASVGLQTAINEGFSGGEKKRNEIFQMAVCNPTLALMDETDSGLDIDALKTVSHGANSLRGPDRAILIVTHYQRMLDYITPDFVHVMIDGRIVKTGDKSLALELEERGYDWVEKDAA